MAAGRTRRERRAQIILARLFPVFERLGLHVTRNHFYEPVPDLRSLPGDIFTRESPMLGVDLQEREQLALLKRIAAFKHEYSGFAADPVPGEPSRYFQRNEQFGRVDADVLHSLIRIHKPRRIIEIGAGYSTLVAAAAVRRNGAEDPAYRCEITSIDPYPPVFLEGLPGLDQLRRTPVQELPPSFFADLAAGDILFIDSSHVLKIGSDVYYEFLELLPATPSGVLIHVHDIFFPTDYPRAMVMEWHRFWNEQYLLQAFLAFNQAFAIRWSSSLMAHRHGEAVREAFPSFHLGGMWPSSFWMERI